MPFVRGVDLGRQNREWLSAYAGYLWPELKLRR